MKFDDAARNFRELTRDAKYYETSRLRPIYNFDSAPLFIMTSD